MRCRPLPEGSAMPPVLLLLIVLGYFLLLLLVAWRTSRGANNQSFFIGNRSSNWMLVAFGMVGTSLSGVTFISVPGAVGSTAFSYFQIVLGQFFGYLVITFVLLPIYYRLRVVSIYAYLSHRLGFRAYQTGAGFFIISRTLGATARLYLVVKILQEMILDGLQVPFWLTASVILLMIVLYTFEGGVKTIVWTDTLQTACMLGGLVICVVFLLGKMDISLLQSLQLMDAAGLSTVFVSDPYSKFFFGKQFLAGVFIAIAMTGLDQEMMQKNISVRTLADAQKNVLMLSTIMLGVVLLFLFLGGLLHLHAATVGINAHGDQIFVATVLAHMPVIVQLIFVIALISALFPSADGAITALTSSMCLDLLGMQRRQDWSEARKQQVRRIVHLVFAMVFLALVLGFKWINDPSMIGLILKLAAYTYGPLLGLFGFGILTRRQPRDSWVPLVALASPAVCWALDSHQRALFGAYELGLELLLLNGALTFAGLWVISKPSKTSQKALSV